ncbi:MAG TPA: hypothetical protein VGL91_00575 [Acidobacteriota bacterium]|jgi:hypothetical protein
MRKKLDTKFCDMHQTLQYVQVFPFSTIPGRSGGAFVSDGSRQVGEPANFDFNPGFDRIEIFNQGIEQIFNH